MTDQREHQTKGKAGAGGRGKLESGEETWWGESPDRRGRETQGELVVGTRSLGLLRASRSWVRGWWGDV